MLYAILIKGAYAILMFLEWLILLYFVSIWLLPDCWLRRTFIEYVGPFFVPIRKLLKKSVLQSKIDFSYIIVLLIIFYLKNMVITFL